PVPAFRIGQMTGDPLTMYLTDALTLCLNMAGIPGLSLPCGLTDGGLPIGLQLIGGLFSEPTLLQVAWNYEQISAFTFGKVLPEIS
ncbi:MAG: Asp-tRNA(Asn)/Glu-tRNA(Gln) amidotransferase subunit GatA, partial [Deltaproteobacteria bacterium]|nr:Asp-tRNA(Asn)/Glu-tRNA(Gln) amidotransferase subunit GatA [Deltaproteobacteria bacterium]